MGGLQFSPRFIILLLLVSFVFLLFKFFLHQFDTKTKIVFCDVGQGDATYIRVKNKVDILVDAGPDRKILSCLGKHMPFYDRQIELAFLSHPQKDHYGGYSFIMDRYKINLFVVSFFENNSSTFQEFKKKLSEERIKIRKLFAGHSIALSQAQILFFWPHKELKTTDVNESSQVFLFTQGDSRILFTGDILTNTSDSLSNQTLGPVSILKVPHHGSKNGLTRALLKKVQPTTAVLSSGKNNPYGHPSPEILQMLKEVGVSIRRTDKEGDIIFTLD